ncbi:hypothetical protein BGZ98_003190 [Dissophora globulifera]|nr:hypothetical protein BGZ98_003190 [Dissophora globulifera]
MRESLQREVEENIQKAKVLKEAMKESSDRDAEILISVEEQEYNRNGRTTPNNRSNISIDRSQQNQQGQPLNGSNLRQDGKTIGSTTNGVPEKRSRFDRFFNRKSSVISSASPSIRNHQVTPHPQRQSQQPQSQHTPSPPLRPSSGPINSSAADLAQLNYLPVEEESEEEEVRRRSMGVAGAGVGEIYGETAGTEVKLHPTRAKTFALPKSLKNLKRRIAALRAKGTDLDAEKKEKEERERAANGGVGPEEKKKFTFIRLLPWKSAKKPAEQETKPVEVAVPTAPVAA